MLETLEMLPIRVIRVTLVIPVGGLDVQPGALEVGRAPAQYCAGEGY